MPWFGLTWTVLALFLAWRYRSGEALVGAVALMATMATTIFQPETSAFIPVGTAIWCLAGIVVAMQGSWIVGTLYACSGLVYVLLGFGFQGGRYAPVHVLSDALVLAAFVLIAASGRGLRNRRHDGRHSGCSPVAQKGEYLARDVAKAGSQR